LALPQAIPGNDSLVEKTLRSTQWVTANSKAVLHQARLRVPEITQRSTLVYCGLECPDEAPNPICFDPPTLLCVGRLAPQKGFDLALSAFATLNERYPRMRVIIAGDGPARDDLELQAKKLGISSRVDFLGWVNRSRIGELINASTLLIVPSRGEEALGLTALEGSFMCRPVIVTKSGGLPEVVVDQETGLTVERENDKQLAEAIAFLIDHPEIAVRMGEAGRLRANTLFGLDRYVDDSDALYKQIITEWKTESHSAPLTNGIR
jgi:glycogen(starch) synthase